MADFETREMSRDDSQEREEAAAEAAMDVAALVADDLPDAAELTFEEKLAELNRNIESIREAVDCGDREKIVALLSAAR